MELNLKNKTINNQEYYVFDAIINGVTVDNVSEVKKFKTAYYDILVFITNDEIEHHINKNDLMSVLATFYSKKWDQLSNDETDITNEIIKQTKILKDI